MRYKAAKTKDEFVFNTMYCNAIFGYIHLIKTYNM